MSPRGPIAKLAKAARLTAEAQRLMLEATEELAVGAEHELAPTPTPAPPSATPAPPPIDDVQAARARRALRRLGAPERP